MPSDIAKQLSAVDIPSGWYYACSSRDLRRGPVGLERGKRKYVAFLDAAGRAVILSARCSHMGANLANGEVAQGRIVCPLHAWEYGGDGKCVHIPATDEIPRFARQMAYPTVEIGGHVVF